MNYPVVSKVIMLQHYAHHVPLALSR